jgi:hypothetical protein
MQDPRIGPELEDVTVAAWVAQPFTLYLLVMRFIAPPSELNWARADPILTLGGRGLMLWLAPALGLMATIAWWRLAKPRRAAVRTGMRDALIGAAVALVVWGIMRAAAGSTLPAFIPPEESSGPGFLLSMTAGYEEEIVCRLGVLPLVYFGLRERIPRLGAALLGLIGSGLVFAVWHAIGEPAFSTAFFMTRMLLPGVVMSLIFLVSPSAIVAGHCTAHLLIPALFEPPA